MLLFVSSLLLHQRDTNTDPVSDGNEAEIGQVFKSTNVPRHEYFVTTKLYALLIPDDLIWAQLTT